MAALLPPGVIQFADADGHPYAGGTLDTWVAGTTTPKTTWTTADKSAANTNPIVLDSAGRCTVYGDGLYRVVLRDLNGVLIWDAASSTLVSDAMAPVIIAPTIADALVLLGVQDAIDTAVAIETGRAEAAEVAEANTRLANDTTLLGAINAEITRAEAAEAANAAAIAAETARAEAAEAGLGGSIGGVLQVRTGTLLTDGGGAWAITFSSAFPTACLTVQGHGMAASPELYYLELRDASGFPTLPSTTGATGMAWVLSGGAGDPPVPATAVNLSYVATGY